MKIKKFQEGGAAPAPQGGGPEEQIAQMAQQIIQQIGPEAAMMLAEMISQMLQQASSAQPAYARKGTKLVRIN